MVAAAHTIARVVRRATLVAAVVLLAGSTAGAQHHGDHHHHSRTRARSSHHDAASPHHAPAVTEHAASASEAPDELPPIVASSSAPPTSSSSPPLDDTPPTPAEDAAAARALGGDGNDVPDPIADEADTMGTAEGEDFGPRAEVADEIAALSDRACLRALQRAQVPFERVHHSVPGIELPIRVVGPIAGVRYRASDRLEIHELMDCRLGVALVRFSRMLRRLGIHEVTHYSTYRPADSHAVARSPVQARHAGGMAIDAAWFIRDDGGRFNVERDFHGRRGRLVCGPTARVPAHEGARLLRTIACDSARRGLFTVILTPNFNYAHRNHFHLEVTRHANWRFVH